MSSMLRVTTLVMLLTAACASTPARCDDGREWDQARARLMASQNSSTGYAIERWNNLASSSRFSFNDYAGFLLTYPGFPQEENLRKSAESALERESPDPKQVAAFFERFPPITNTARARHALALAALRWEGARTAAIAAWRGGTMSEASESALLYLYGSSFSRET